MGDISQPHDPQQTSEATEPQDDSHQALCLVLRLSTAWLCLSATGGLLHGCLPCPPPARKQPHGGRQPVQGPEPAVGIHGPDDDKPHTQAL